MKPIVEYDLHRVSRFALDPEIATERIAAYQRMESAVSQFKLANLPGPTPAKYSDTAKILPFTRDRGQRGA